MTNPLRMISLNNKFYNYISDTYKEGIGLKNSVVDAQNARHFNSIQGSKPKTITLSFLLENTKTILFGESIVGITTWLGVSQLSFLENYINAKGASMPLTFVTPYGATYLVVPTGEIGIEIFNQDNPSTISTEFRISLTLEATI